MTSFSPTSHEVSEIDSIFDPDVFGITLPDHNGDVTLNFGDLGGSLSTGIAGEQESNRSGAAQDAHQAPFSGQTYHGCVCFQPESLGYHACQQIPQLTSPTCLRANVCSLHNQPFQALGSWQQASRLLNYPIPGFVPPTFNPTVFPCSSALSICPYQPQAPPCMDNSTNLDGIGRASSSFHSLGNDLPRNKDDMQDWASLSTNLDNVTLPSVVDTEFGFFDSLTPTTNLEDIPQQSASRSSDLSSTSVSSDHSKDSELVSVALGASAASVNEPTNENVPPNPLTRKRQFPCPHSPCPSIFNSQTGLDRHLATRKHRNEVGYTERVNRFKCQVSWCKRRVKGFSRKDHLMKHMERMHHGVHVEVEG